MHIFKNWKIFSLWVIFSEAVGITAGILTREGTKIYNAQVVKPFLAPPPLVFPVAWTVLYALMGWGAAKIFLASPSTDRTKSIVLFFAQLGFNFGWCFVFFSFMAFGWAFVWLVVLIALVAAMVFYFRKIDKTAAILQTPYFLWLIFAAYLNFSVWLLN